MVTCPSCGAIVFVDMDGQAHVANEIGEASNESQESSSERSPEIFPEISAEITYDISPVDVSPPDLSPPDLSPPNVAPMSLEPMPEESAPADLDMNAFLGYSGSNPDEGGAGAPSQNDPNDPLGISAYANSEMSAAKNGPLVVSLIISGIDAKDLRDEIRQALQDSRFGWDALALMAQIKGGVLRIDRVSPVKATIIINRIKNLSVKIRWEQNAITEIDPLEKEP